MTEMSMNRVIHSAFRRDIDRFENALKAFPAGNSHRAAELWTAWANFDNQLTEHHTGEHEIAWPTLRTMGVRDELITQWDSEHERLAEALHATDSAMRTLRGSPTAANAQAAAEAITMLRTVAAEHLDNEEAELEPFYLANKNSPELKAMGRKFGRVSPPVAGTFFAWLADGATSDEKAALKQNVPAPVVTIIGGIFGRSYRRTVAPVWRS